MGEAWECAFLASSQVRLLLLVWGPHFQSHWIRHRKAERASVAFHNTHCIWIPWWMVFPPRPPTFQEGSDLVYLVDNYVPSAWHRWGVQWFVKQLDRTPALIHGTSLSHKNTWPCPKAARVHSIAFSWEVHRVWINQLHITSSQSCSLCSWAPLPQCIHFQ